MVKRFCDTDLWQKEWFQELCLKHKVLLKYIFENCDCAGVWNINFRLASFIIGESVTIDDIHYINSIKKQFEIIDNKNIFVIDFINFQYGTLSENCKPHKSIIEKLKKYHLYERVSKGYPKGIETLEEKEKEKDNIQEKDKEKDISSSLVLSSSLEVEQSVRRDTSNDKQSVRRASNGEEQHIYGKYNNVCMSVEQYNKLLGICASQKLLDELVDSLSENIETGKEHPFRSDFPNSHFVRLQQYRKFRFKNPERFKTSGSSPPKSFKEQEWENYENRINKWYFEGEKDKK